MANKFNIKFQFLWYDFWIGWYYDRANQTLYICPLPMCVIKVWKAQKILSPIGHLV